MTTVYEGKQAVYIGTAANLIDEDHENAWAEKHIISNPANKWILGKYVEADNANSNGQYFQLEGLRMQQATISHAPLDINHSPLIVGAFVATDFVYPTESAEEGSKAIIEALSVFWRHYFEDEYEEVEKAHKNGALFYSMSCVPVEVACIGEVGCGQKFKYEGRTHASYCEHINHPEPGVVKDLIKPHFTGGALIVPPTRPGWNRANIDQISSEFTRDKIDAFEKGLVEVASELPEAKPSDWQNIMKMIVAFGESHAVARQ